MISPEDRAAIDAWLATNEVKKFPTGHSAVYDEFGRKRASVKFVLANIAKRIRARKNHASMTVAELAANLEVPVSDVVAACAAHRIKVSE